MKNVILIETTETANGEQKSVQVFYNLAQIQKVKMYDNKILIFYNNHRLPSVLVDDEMNQFREQYLQYWKESQ